MLSFSVLLLVSYLALSRIKAFSQNGDMLLPVVFLVVSEVAVIVLACFGAAAQAQSKRKLKQTNERMSAILENMPSMIYLKSANACKYTFLSDNLLSLFGCNAEQFRERYSNPAYTVFKSDKEMVLKQIEEQERHTGAHNLIYRIVDFNGKVVWVHDKGVIIKDEKKNGKLWRYSTLIDISDIHDAQEDLKVNEERYKMVMQHTRSVVFDWNIKLDSISFSEMWVTLFGNHLTYDNFSTQIGSSPELNEDDRSVLSIFIKQFIHGQIESSRIKCRIINHEGKLVWCEISGKLILDDYGKPSRVIGLIHDIDREKRENDKLRFKAQRDSLTKMYNKEMTRSLIRSALETSSAQSRHVMFVIDIDNFKTINDTKGHMFGDEVLKAISKRVLAIFRSTDIVGRVGGDEFVVFLQDLGDGYSVKKKAEQIRSVFEKPFEIDGEPYTVTGSVGISLYPQDATNYGELFKKADEALYSCKRNGKNAVAFYNNSINPDIPLPPIHKKAIKAMPLDE